MALFTLIAWIPLVFGLFLWLDAKRATAFAYCCGWCFLPVAGFAIPGLPDFTKSTATSLAVAIAILVLHAREFASFRPALLDVPALALCTLPFATSIANGLGPYDGLSNVVTEFSLWSLPYFIGRVIFQDRSDIKYFMIALAATGVAYIPFCLYEVKMSPQLHRMFYGYFQHDFRQTIRFDGWRPTVFMQHGLQVANWMGGALLALTAIYMANQRRFIGIPTALLIAALGVTFVLLKSVGAAILFIIGLVILLISIRTQNRIAVLLIPIAIILFLGLRIYGIVDGRGIAQLTRTYISVERAQSLEFRLINEDLLLAHAMRQPVLGWGGWGRNRVHDEDGKGITITDGLWIIILGTRGVLGLLSFYTFFLLGPIYSIIRSRIQFPHDNMYPITLAGVMVVFINAIDTIPNAMLSPPFLVLIGAITSNGLAQFRPVVYRLHSEQVEDSMSQIAAVEDYTIACGARAI